jgi:hypothetical protein
MRQTKPQSRRLRIRPRNGRLALQSGAFAVRTAGVSPAFPNFYFHISVFCVTQRSPMATSKTSLGYLVQLGGITGFTIGGILSLHHVAVGAAFLGGAAAFYVGKKIRTLA